MEESKTKNHIAPYVSFVSFTNLLDWLRDSEIPAQLDRSFWGTKYSGSLGSQLMSALRFFSLLEEETPTSKLESLVSAGEEERKSLLADLLREAYSSVFMIDLHRATPKMLEEAFDDIGGGVHTRRKAVAFFINACKHADIPLSSAVRKKARNKSPGTNLRQRKESNSKQVSNGSNKTVVSDHQETSSQPPSQNLTTLKLNSGGSLTLTLDVNVFVLSKDDRNFVNKLVDEVQAYESKSGKEQESDDSNI